MHFIKLDATESTNDFLKSHASQSDVPNFTVVTAQSQTKGRGQMGAKWVSESGKNLIMSILLKEFIDSPSRVFELNILISISVIEALKPYQIPSLTIKWPNDIMSCNKKTGGILIENIIRGNGSIFSVVGIGLNGNQLDFSDLPRATSIAAVTGNSIETESLAKAISARIQYNVKNYDGDKLKRDYIEILFKKDVPTAFESEGRNFMGIIRGVESAGRLELELDNNLIQTFDLKQIAMLY